MKVLFLNHAINKTPGGELLLQIQGMIAEYERAKILERSRRDKRHGARRGLVNVLSVAPYGCRYVSVKATEGDARCEIINEEAVWEDVSDLLCDPERIQQEYQRRLSDDNNESSLALKQNETTINKMKRAIAHLIDAYEDDLLTKEEFEPRVWQSKVRLTQLQDEHVKRSVRANEQDELRSVIIHLDECSQQLSDGIETLTWNDKRKVIRALVKRVEVGKEVELFTR